MSMRPDRPGVSFASISCIGAVTLLGCAAGDPDGLAGGSRPDSSLNSLQPKSGSVLSLEGPGVVPSDAGREASSRTSRPVSREQLVRDAALDLVAIQHQEQAAAKARSDRGATNEVALSPRPRASALDEDYVPTADDAAADAAWAWIAVSEPVGGEHDGNQRTSKIEASRSEPRTTPTGSAEHPAASLATRLASTLRSGKQQRGETFSEPLALASLESLYPGVLGELNDPKSAISTLLSREDRATLMAARDRVASDPDVPVLAANLASTQLSKIAPPRQLRIPVAALCTKVQSFGKYAAFSSNVFRAGSPVRALVYTELDGFSSRASGTPGGESYTIDLAQSLTLYHDESGLQAWHRPAQSVTETTRARRRDFYLVQQIELPANLSIGRYNLKATVVDKATGATSEAVIPLSITADPAPAAARGN